MEQMKVVGGQGYLYHYEDYYTEPTPEKNIP